MTKVHQLLVGALLPLAINKALDRASDGDSADEGNYTAGTVVIVKANKARHKRVINKGYILVDDEETPLGIRGEFAGRKFDSGDGDIRPARGKEIVDTLQNLNLEQVKALVCSLSGKEPFRTALRDVVNNPDAQCECRE